jgi:hypothetical protein
MPRGEPRGFFASGWVTFRRALKACGHQGRGLFFNRYDHGRNGKYLNDATSTNGECRMRSHVKKSIRVWSILLIVFGAFIPAKGDAESSRPEYLVLAVLQSENDPQYVKPIQKWFIKIYAEALRRMDITLRYRVLPPTRASLYSDEGTVDGELSRVEDYNLEHPNLVRVDEPHLFSVFSAFATDPTITLDGWQSLTNTNDAVEYRRGIKQCAQNLTPIIPPERLSEIHSIEAGVRKLVMGRTDIFIEPEDGVFDFLRTQEFQRISNGRTIYKVGVMEKTTSHLWLHKKHSDLVPQLSSILSDMKKEGLFELYLEQEGLNPLELKW